ncbi:tRNA lysidine(34) synthetase TilS [Neobacillus sp. PS3-40]|uniref:tRNA lysidine(34) synthetase TilS n=1 Tax=Neobacillus sp. PS3-40 TaxID=3070679 RepID=UPI0027DF9DFE|nr:tRNA lysidine(34) synthetase TilS [Neobacillus sp. PS3-40]WML42534.1 tRNA lysidine(34) synthetase TilS [Neobacillus sp. PS3-40]
MLETKVEAFLERQSFLLDNKEMVVGVSGGPDSLALLHFLLGQRVKRNLSIVVAHVDHMFRGAESFQDAMFVKGFCEQHSIPFEMVQINVPKIMTQTGQSSEVAAREARFSFFAKVMDMYNYSYLALAHHGDDQIETILMRLTRGSTGKARAGIPFLRPFESGFIFRPFLSITKQEIKQYCQDSQINPRLDPSNEQSIYTRNRFRKEILPFLKSENRKVHEHFQRFSEELQGDEIFLQDLTKEFMKTVMTKREAQQITIDIKRFLAMPLPLQRRGIQLILNYLYEERPSSLSAIHIDQIFSLIHHLHPSGKLDFPEGLKVIRSYLKCYFQFEVENSQSYHFELGDPGQIDLPNFGKLMMDYVNSPSNASNSCIALFHADKIKLPLLVRTRKNGDRMSLKGMEGSRKLKDIFIDCKVSIQERDRWPIVTDREGFILWLPGLKKSALEGLDNLDNSVRNYIQLTYTRNEL